MLWWMNKDQLGLGDIHNFYHDNCPAQISWLIDIFCFQPKILPALKLHPQCQLIRTLPACCYIRTSWPIVTTASPVSFLPPQVSKLIASTAITAQHALSFQNKGLRYRNSFSIFNIMKMILNKTTLYSVISSIGPCLDPTWVFLYFFKKFLATVKV